MKLFRKSMMLMFMLFGIYFVAADVSAASAGSSCYQDCIIQRHYCLIDRNCFDDPNNRFCKACETRYETCINVCNYR